MVCRAPTSSTTCAGTLTGATLTYDNEGRLGTWQNTPSSPTTTDSFLYDGEGNRVEQVAQQSGVGTTDTVYVGGLEEVTTTTPTGGQPTTSTTAYYGSIALSVNGALSFLVSDHLGSAEEALDSGGHVTASRLYTPYGGSRYTSGTFPTEYGFTGYRADSATGLDYANARYYDPTAGQFISADTTLQGGLNRYAYVGGSPETRIDPSGHAYCDESGCNGGFGGGGDGVDGGDSGIGGVPGETGPDAFSFDSDTIPLDGVGVEGVPPADAGDVIETQEYYDGTTVNEVVNPTTGEVDGEIVNVEGVNEFEPESEVNANIENPEVAKETEVDRVHAENAAKETPAVNGTGDGNGDGSGNPPTVYRGVRAGNPPDPAADVPPSASGVRSPNNPGPNGEIDIDPNGTGMVQPGEGASVYDKSGALASKAWQWWGTTSDDLPEGLQLVRRPGPPDNPLDITRGGVTYLHYQIEPAYPMSVDDYLNLFNQIRWFRAP